MILLAIFLFSIQGVFIRLYSKKNESSFTNCILYNLTSISSSTILLLTFYHDKFAFDSYVTIGCGIIFGVLVALTSYFRYQTIEKGPLSYSALYLSCSLVVPFLWGSLIWGEKVSPLQIGGVFLLIVSLFLGAYNKKIEKISVSWFVFGIATLLFNGFVSVTQKYHQMIMPSNNAFEFLFVGYLTSAVMYSIIYLIKGEKNKISLKSNLWSLACISSVCGILGNVLIMKLATTVNSTILFPVVNGGIVIISSVIAFIFYKESLFKTKILGLFLGIVAIALIAM